MTEVFGAPGESLTPLDWGCRGGRGEVALPPSAVRAPAEPALGAAAVSLTCSPGSALVWRDCQTSSLSEMETHLRRGHSWLHQLIHPF